MSDLRSLRAATRAFQSGDYVTTRALLSAAGSADALHLRGLAERRLGEHRTALATLRKAALKAPANAELARNLGLAARTVGALDEAREAFATATRLQPGYVAAWQSLGRVAVDLEQWEDARAAYQQALAHDPASVPARYGIATVLVETGEAQVARDMLEQLVAEGRDDAGIQFMLGRCDLAAGAIDDAVARLTRAYRAEPTATSLTILSETLWMSGARNEFRALLDSTRSTPELLPLAADLARQADWHDVALELAAAADAGQSAAHTVKALVFVEQGNATGAEQAAQTALAGNPADRAALAALVSALLMRGDAAAAMTALAPRRAAEPWDQHWLAFEAEALRIIAPDKYAALMDPNALVQVYELAPPPGYSSIETFNTALLAELDKDRPYRQRPLGQSLRGGTQTQNDLLRSESPVVKAYLRALEQPVQRYLDQLSVAPEHPVVARHAGGGFRISESWSVELAAGGHHVSHVHPRGWLSSAYYVAVPTATTASRAARAGWIKFGEAPFRTTPPSTPLRWIEPRAGLLVLFPSFLWHGTEPFADGGRRVTAPFDVVPALAS